MNKKLVAGVIAGVGAAAGAAIVGKNAGKKCTDEKKDTHLTSKEIWHKVQAGGDTKPGIERQIYRDMYRFLMDYDDTALEDVFYDDLFFDEPAEKYAEDFAKKTADYIDSHWVNVKRVSGRQMDGTVISGSKSPDLFDHKACRIGFIEEEMVSEFPIQRYTELWYTEIGMWYVVDRVDFKHNYNITYRSINPCSDTEYDIAYPAILMKESLDEFADMCVMEKALEDI